MSVANAGIATTAAFPEANDTGKLGGENKKDLNKDDIDITVRPVAPDQFDANFETSKKELYSYYSYYIGQNGLASFRAFSSC